MRGSGHLALVMGLSCMGIAYLYSWRRIRLKSKPVVDLISHGLMLAGLQYLSAYFSFEPSPFSRWVYPFVFVVGISLYGELINELRDLKGDREAGITHTANLIGQQAAFWLMTGLLSIGIGSGMVTIFIVHLIPVWTLLVWAALASILVIPSWCASAGTPRGSPCKNPFINQLRSRRHLPCCSNLSFRGR